MVYWVTGLSGAGKTTTGKLLVDHLSQSQPTVWLDGDKLREVFGNDLGYETEDRLKGAWRYARLCKLLSDQGITVVCCTIAMFHQIRDWNRDNFIQYREIYLEVPLEVLQERDQKGLYSQVAQGVISNVVGVDSSVELPRNYDLKIINDGRWTPEQVLEEITSHFKLT